MIEQSQLEFWWEKLKQGERLSLHRKEQQDLVEEVLALRVLRQNEQKAVDTLKATHERELYGLRVQLQQMNGTLSMLAGRGSNTQGTYEQGKPVQHGGLNEWPSHAWGPIDGKTCDWGGCNEPAAVARFDAHGLGWLPCCKPCSEKPV